jgi:hypothetical protein
MLEGKNKLCQTPKMLCQTLKHFVVVLDDIFNVNHSGHNRNFLLNHEELLQSVGSGLVPGCCIRFQTARTGMHFRYKTSPLHEKWY